MGKQSRGAGAIGSLPDFTSLNMSFAFPCAAFAYSLADFALAESFLALALRAEASLCNARAAASAEKAEATNCWVISRRGGVFVCFPLETRPSPAPPPLPRIEPTHRTSAARNPSRNSLASPVACSSSSGVAGFLRETPNAFRFLCASETRFCES